MKPLQAPDQVWLGCPAVTILQCGSHRKILTDTAVGIRAQYLSTLREYWASKSGGLRAGSLVSDQSGDSFTSPTPFFVSFLSHSRAAHSPMLVLRGMKPAPFQYIAARTLAQALALKAEYGDEARFLAGGQSLMPTHQFSADPAGGPDRHQSPDRARRNAQVRAGQRAHWRSDALSGARARARDGARPAACCTKRCRISPTRRSATAGPSAAILPTPIRRPKCRRLSWRSRARLRAQSVRGERWIAASDFFAGALVTALAADEMLMEVELPVAKPRSGACFMEVARRRGDFALIGVACIVRLDDDGPLRRGADQPVQCRRDADPGRGRRRVAGRPADRRGGNRSGRRLGAGAPSIPAAASTPARNFSGISPAS